ncbi:unnamed protein product, partial [Candidula unifasciata]
DKDYYQLKTYELNPTKQNIDDYSWRLKDAASKARVFILLIEDKILRDVILEAHSLGYATSGEFVFIVIIGITDVPNDKKIWKAGQDTDETVRQALAHALFPYVNDSWGTLPPNLSREIKDRASRDYSFNTNKEPDASLARYYDAVSMYATVVNETIAEGGNPYDGLAITKRIWNRTFPGLLERVTVNEVGDSDSDVMISAINPTTQKLQQYALLDSETKSLIFLQNKPFPWPLNNGISPADEPVCGYMRDRCSDKEHTEIMRGVGGFFAVVTVVGLVVSAVMFRRWKKFSNKDLWWWKIAYADLILTDRKFLRSMPSFNSK